MRHCEQFVIRRKAYAMIKKAFDENDIKFAFPTVQIAGEGEPSTAAVAQHALKLQMPAAAESACLKSPIINYRPQRTAFRADTGRSISQVGTGTICPDPAIRFGDASSRSDI